MHGPRRGCEYDLLDYAAGNAVQIKRYIAGDPLVRVLEFVYKRNAETRFILDKR